MQGANQIAIAVENALAYGEIRALKDTLAQEKLYLEDEIRSERNFEDIIGKSAALRRVLRPSGTPRSTVGSTGAPCLESRFSTARAR
jgi:formate hydrogenlyase transcriptional activator